MFICLSVSVSTHPGEHYSVSANGYLPPPAHMFGRAFQETRSSTAAMGGRKIRGHPSVPTRLV